MLMPKEKSELMLEEITKYLNKNNKANEEDLIEGIWYMNANDGTDFDAGMNDRTCEFMRFYKDDEMGAIKVYVTSNNKLEGYWWGKGEMKGHELEPETFSFDFGEVVEMLIENFDNLDVMDSLITDSPLDNWYGGIWSNGEDEEDY